MKKRSFQVILALLIVLPSLVTACGPTAAPTPDIAPTQPPPTATAIPTQPPPTATLPPPTMTPAPPTPTQPPRGGMVDIGGRALYYECAGEGSPTVIVEDSLGTGPKGGWSGVIGPIRQSTRICAYARAGRGKSDDATVPRTSQDVAEDLHALLVNAQIAPPTFWWETG